MGNALEAVARVTAVPAMLKAITELTGLRLSLVAEVTEDRWVCCAVNDQLGFGLEPGGELAVETTLCSEVRSARSPILISHASEDPSYCNHPTPKMYAFESYISVPIFLQSQRYFGNLCALDSRPIPLDDKTKAMFEAFAALLGLQLEVEADHDKTHQDLSSERATSTLREQFIAVLGHDLRSPLAAITNGTQLLSTRLAQLDDPLVTKTLKILERSTKRMRHMVDDVLDFARGRLSGGVTVTLASVDLNELLRDAIDEYRGIHGGEIVTSFETLPPLMCDRGRVAQAITNLVGNAVQHGTKGRPVEIRSRATAEALVIEVQNHGVTIPPERIASMFEPYHRSEGSLEGLGLGLYIVAEIMRAHGGRVECSSVDGLTTFRLVLPKTSLPG